MLLHQEWVKHGLAYIFRQQLEWVQEYSIMGKSFQTGIVR